MRGEVCDIFLWLHFSRDEANAIAAIAPTDTKLVALDFQANRALATQGELSQYRILHFATHGLLNSAEASWQSGRTNISLVNIAVGTSDAALNLNYQVRTAKEADKL